MIPKCCQECSRRVPNECTYFKRCPEYIRWFRETWADIQKAAAQKFKAKEAKENTEK
jgi:hypothetical protein